MITKAIPRKDFIPVFIIFKEGVTTGGPVTIIRNPDEQFDEQAKRTFYTSLGYTVTNLTPEESGKRY